MAEVDFHILAEHSSTVRLQAACALVERAFLAGERVLVWLDDAAAQTAFDTLLWTFSDRAFVPHEALADIPDTCEAPVQLFSGAAMPSIALPGKFNTLMQLRQDAGVEALHFARVIEVVDATPACRDAGRTRFKFYRSQGATPRHHEWKDRI
jgi:DNA polymerase III subunit chi